MTEPDFEVQHTDFAAPRQRINSDPESVERGLVSLVLTLVELLRQLMERQAIRRVDRGDLTDEQIERIGTTLMLLEEKMASCANISVWNLKTSTSTWARSAPCFPPTDKWRTRLTCQPGS
jgi:Gas vesicle protein K